MQLLQKNQQYNLHFFKLEKEFEELVERLSDYIFGSSSIYISKKKRIKGSKIISIPDGYLIDMADAANPALYIIENEIVAHDAFEHIGIQLLRFATSFDGAKRELRQHLMDEISADKDKLKRFEAACENSNYRNIDEYLDAAVYADFKAIVVIDEASEELHNVLKNFKYNISVMELKTFKSGKADFIYQYDTLYDEEEAPVVQSVLVKSESASQRLKRRERRAKCDTIVVPAQPDGFKSAFLGEHKWWAVRIGAAMKDKIKYIAGYQVAPISAITHVAEVDAIVPFENTGKYIIKFKSAPVAIKPIKLKESKNKPQSAVYIQHEDLKKAKSFDELIAY